MLNSILQTDWSESTLHAARKILDFAVHCRYSQKLFENV